ncbi:hypothetical protein CFN78_06860 [Amycolatopsis antarctica]|uniref:Uncharacterized protein n=1 Tax=Amycolatopsis antarctica TaxID=1854586 RepID=A0A263D6K0_9PSEU|nr:hypothetical protein [Amycolatopsis antarctica]OZM74001.1 hypothetical protein CFN78_06860 [Amycolatopsis antarctica]
MSELSKRLTDAAAKAIFCENPFDRDELAAFIRLAIDCHLDGGHIAERILAAGWRPPTNPADPVAIHRVAVAIHDTFETGTTTSFTDVHEWYDEARAAIRALTEEA